MVIEVRFFMKKMKKKMKNHVLPVFHTWCDIFIILLLFYMFSTLMSLKDRLRLKLKVKTEISLCMAIMLDNPWQSLYTQYYRTVLYLHVVCSDNMCKTNLCIFVDYNEATYSRPNLQV